MLKDMMPHFELFQPADLQNALDLADRLGNDGWPLAGGLDSLNSFKDRSKRIQSAIDLAGIPELRGISETAHSGKTRTSPCPASPAPAGPFLCRNNTD